DLAARVLLAADPRADRRLLPAQQPQPSRLAAVRHRVADPADRPGLVADRAPEMTRSRTYLLPALFILVGLLALLVNLGVISTDRLYRLADLWPLLLVVLGLELLVNRARLPSAIETTASVLIVAVALAAA